MARSSAPKLPQLKKGARVRTTYLNHDIDDWTAEAKKDREWDVTGTVMRLEDGSYYLVRHDDESTGYYDLTELELLPTSRKALVYLVFAGNRCYANATSHPPEGLTIDLQAGAWTWRERTYSFGRQHPTARYDGSRIIGVYDRSNDRHLSNMLEHAYEACKGQD